ncbi:MAG: lipopolysaccharide biosynthesis protein [Intrasporangium sp.]|uniref:lipopolysaccharide biosynthesis protein n=1 Tax=Intrasporangium sp. TaxID=1925024 RepID=UPI00264A33E1|nr:lipopolysaccharide biosynthesis protein [Intrasporangium sp.]MDN5796755.1 lipopolysaccharide biosynthesis protein [Intrasporangium sp.]
MAAGSNKEQAVSIEAGSGEEESGRSLAGQVGRGAMWAVAANIVMRFASIAITAVLARLLSPEDFGVFAIALAVFLVVASLAELGMGSAVARAATEPEDIAPTVASISILVGTGVGLLMAAFAPALATLLGQPEAAGPIRILSICVALTGFFAVPGAQLVREFRQGRIFLAAIVGFVTANPILIVLALHGGGAEAFAWSRVIGQLASGVVFWFSTSHRYLPGWRSDQVKPLLMFGLPLSLANLVNWTLLNADYLILGRLVSAAEVGVYMIAFNVASWSTSVLGSVLNSVVVPALGRVSGDPPKLRQAITRAGQLVGLVSLPIAAICVGLSDPIIRTIYGDKWIDSIPVLSVLAVYGAVYAFSLLFVNVLVATGQTMRLLLIQLGWVVVLVPTMVLGLRHWGLEGVAWAHVVTIGLVALPAYLLAVRRSTSSGVRALLPVVLRPLSAAVLAGATSWLASFLVGPEILRLLVGGLAGGAVYLALTGALITQQIPARFVPRWVPTRWRSVEAPEAS